MKDAMSYLAFGALVMGGVPLRYLPELDQNDAESAPEKKKRPHGRNLLSWLKIHIPTLESHRTAHAH